MTALISNQTQLPLRVLKSAAGYYIGTTDEDGFPNSRDSVEYYETRDKAKEALHTEQFTRRNNP